MLFSLSFSPRIATTSHEPAKRSRRRAPSRRPVFSAMAADEQIAESGVTAHSREDFFEEALDRMGFDEARQVARQLDAWYLRLG